MKLRWVLPLALLLAANLVALGGVLWNRTGDPEAVVVLTERELELPGRWREEMEDSGLSLHLRWRHDNLSTANFDADKLRRLGFDFAKVPTAEEAFEDPARAYVPRQSKPLLIVLEMDGELWRGSLAKRRREGPAEWQSPEDHARRLRRAEVEESRLRVADAGADRRELRSRYPDRFRYVIVPGVVEIWVNYTPEPSLMSRVEVLVRQVHAPRGLRGPLDELRQRDASTTSPNTFQPPRYRATVAFGRRLEPILRRIELLDAEPVPSTYLE
ncbi:MAG: DUF4824 family protein [Acidobacteriota bacterium]